MTRWLPGSLLLALALMIVYQWKDWPPGSPNGGLNDIGSSETAVTEEAEPDPLDQLASSESKDAYSSLTDRPLFRPERRPDDEADSVEDSVPETDLEASLAGMDLSAVIITPTLVSAWVKDPAQERLRRLRIGDEFAGWSVQTILPDRVLLERQGVQDALILRDYGKVSPPDSPMSIREQMPRMPRMRRPADSPEDDPQDN